MEHEESADESERLWKERMAHLLKRRPKRGAPAGHIDIYYDRLGGFLWAGDEAGKDVSKMFTRCEPNEDNAE